MKALVTGVNGFVGPYLKNHLMDSGINAAGTDLHDGEHVDFISDLTVADSIKKVVNEVNPDYVFHLAAQSSVKLSFENPDLTKKVNVEGTKNLLSSIKNENCKVLIVSSAEVYGKPNKLPITESTPSNPISPYAESKVEQEKLTINSKISAHIVRSFNHTGPGQKPIFVCSDFAKQIAEIEKGKDPIIHTGDISIKRDFSDVRDIVRAYLDIVKLGVNNDIYNACSGKCYSIKDLLDILLAFSKKEIKIVTNRDKLRKVEIPILYGDHSKLTKDTGWTPSISIEKTLSDLLQYWRRVL